MIRLRPALSVAFGVLVVGLLAVSSAAAATQTVALKSSKGDQATITLNRQTKRALAKNHIALRTGRPATRRGSRASFPQKAGRWNFATTSGNVSYSGVTHFVHGRHSVTLTRLSFTRTVSYIQCPGPSRRA